MRRLVVLLVVPALLALAACGSSDTSGERPRHPGSASAPQSPSGSGSSEQATSDLSAVKVTAGPGPSPAVTFPTPFKVSSTQVKVLSPGHGPTIRKNESVLGDYIGVNGTTDQKFDSSYDRGYTAAFSLVDGALIPGFIQGLVGQKIGSRVLIAIPPKDGYGPQGQPTARITGDDTLLFVVDLKKIALPGPRGTKVAEPAGVPNLEVDSHGVPTGFSATKATKPAPDKLEVYPVIKGHGPVVHKGETAVVHWLGAKYPDGQPFDQLETGPPQGVPVGTGQLIKGFDQGLLGQRVGSRLILVIPPAYGFPPDRLPQGITAKDTVIYTVDILGAA